MADKYGIPSGGDPYPGQVKFYKNNRKQLSWPQVLSALRAGGWPADLLDEAAAVVAAESDRHPYIYNTYKSGHFGLFQISRSAWKEFFALGSDAWTNPTANAAKGYSIYKKQGWGAWEGHGNAKYQAALKEMQSGGHLKESWNVEAPGLLDNIQDGLSDAVEGATGLDEIGDVISGAWEAVTTPAFWMRVAYGATGVILVVGGLFLVVRNSPVAKKAAALGEKAVSAHPAGKAAVAAKKGSS